MTHSAAPAVLLTPGAPSHAILFVSLSRYVSVYYLRRRFGVVHKPEDIIKAPRMRCGDVLLKHSQIPADARLVHERDQVKVAPTAERRRVLVLRDPAPSISPSPYKPQPGAGTHVEIVCPAVLSRIPSAKISRGVNVSCDTNAAPCRVTGPVLPAIPAASTTGPAMPSQSGTYSCTVQFAARRPFRPYWSASLPMCA